MAAHRGEIFPLHVGDTWRQAPEGGRPEELPRGIPGINRYTYVKGLSELRDALVSPGDRSVEGYPPRESHGEPVSRSPGHLAVAHLPRGQEG